MGKGHSQINELSQTKRYNCKTNNESCSLRRISFHLEKKIAEKVFKHKIYNDLILNFDQTPLGFTCRAKTTFTEENAETVPTGNLDDKRQITGTFVVKLSGEFLPIQLIYTGMTDLSHPKVEFPKGFDITYSSNHWANKEIVMSLLKKIVFPLVNEKGESLSLSKDAKALLIFDVFKGQTTPAVNDLLKDNNCIVQHVPNNHTNLFQPLDISVNKSAKSFISDKYQEWYASEVTSQLGKVIDPYNVKVDVNLTTLNPFSSNVTFLYSLKTSEKLWFSYFFRGYGNGTLD